MNCLPSGGGGHCQPGRFIPALKVVKRARLKPAVHVILASLLGGIV